MKSGWRVDVEARIREKYYKKLESEFMVKGELGDARKRRKRGYENESFRETPDIVHTDITERAETPIVNWGWEKCWCGKVKEYCEGRRVMLVWVGERKWWNGWRRERNVGVGGGGIEMLVWVEEGKKCWFGRRAGQEGGRTVTLSHHQGGTRPSNTHKHTLT